MSLFSRAFHPAPVTTESRLSSEGFCWTTRMELPCWRNSGRCIVFFWSLRDKFSSMASEESRNGTTLRLVTGTMRTKFPIVHSSTLVPSDIPGGPGDGHEKNNRARCIVFPTTAVTENYPPSVLSETAKAPRCGIWQACLRQQHHWRSENPRFSLIAEDVREDCSAHCIADDATATFLGRRKIYKVLFF